MNEKTNPLFWKFCSIRWREERPPKAQRLVFDDWGDPVRHLDDTRLGRPPVPSRWECCVRTPHGAFITDFPSRVRAAEYADIVKLACILHGIISDKTSPVKFNFPRDHYPEDITPKIGYELQKFLDRMLFNQTAEGRSNRAARLEKAEAKRAAKAAKEDAARNARIDAESDRY